MSNPTPSPSEPRPIRIPKDLISDDGPAIEGHSFSPSPTHPRASSFSGRRYSLSSSYRRPTVVSYGGSRPAVAPGGQLKDVNYLTPQESSQVRRDEQQLLHDNQLIPGKKNGGRRGSILGETSALLGTSSQSDDSGNGNELDAEWERAVKDGKIKTTLGREAITLALYSGPLTLTFILQYSLTVASIFTVGHLGKLELGAVSLASMTANITGYAVYQGLATSLDTLCAQAYGSGQKHVVGIQLQRMVYFLLVVSIPICLIWYNAELLLNVIVPEPDSARLAALYLRILIFGAPAYAIFESGKRFVQAQGLFSATMYVLLIAAPLNALMNWVFVWKFQWGFIGAPIAVAVTDNLLPLLLFSYVYFIDGRQCWNGFTKQALRNWMPMIMLSIPGFVMLEAEFIAFEILTLASSYFSTAHLAAQSILSTTLSLAFMIPFPISIAACTRVANLIGATLKQAARTSALAAFYIGLLVGVFNCAILWLLRAQIASLFTSDPEVIHLVAQVMPVGAVFQLYNASTAISNGLLRGLGMQKIGSWVNLICYYVVAMPISFGAAFGLGWELQGLWLGVAVGLGLIAIIEWVILWRMDWQQAVDDAQARNEGN